MLLLNFHFIDQYFFHACAKRLFISFADFKWKYSSKINSTVHQFNWTLSNVTKSVCPFDINAIYDLLANFHLWVMEIPHKHKQTNFDNHSLVYSRGLHLPKNATEHDWNISFFLKSRGEIEIKLIVLFSSLNACVYLIYTYYITWLFFLLLKINI